MTHPINTFLCISYVNMKMISTPHVHDAEQILCIIARA